MIKEQWIHSKYLHKEFTDPSQQPYRNGRFEGVLYKKKKHEDKYVLRKFEVSAVDGTLQYAKEVSSNSGCLKIISPKMLNRIRGCFRRGHPENPVFFLVRV